MKRLIIILGIIVFALQAHAVLKEKDLEQTLQILRKELTAYHRELSGQIEMNRRMSENVRNQLMSALQQSNQNSLMLYSQKQDYVFDLTYACHEATEQYQNFHQQQLPFKVFMQKTETDIARYEQGLIPYVNSRYRDLSDIINSGKKLDKDQIAKLKKLIEAYTKSFQV